MSGPGTVPPRLWFSVAPDAPVAVIMRQGPAKWTRMIRWDMHKNTLHPGQWIHARVPNHAISPDGKYVLSFVQSYRAKHELGTWVALSKPPWFTALAVWAIGDSWGGGCSFLGPRQLLITPGMQPVELVKGTLPKGWACTSYTPPTEHYRNTPLVEATATIKAVRGDAVAAPTRYAAPAGDGLIVESRTDGCLYRWSLKKDSWQETLVLDGNGMEPEEREAPPEATRWG